MNILFITDLEGVPGVTDIEFMERPGEKYEKAREYLTDCINKTADFCFKHGADKIYFLDGHAGPTVNNVIDEKIDKRLVKIGLAEWDEIVREHRIDVCIELGSHARAGTLGGFLDHTHSSKEIFSRKLNGREMSELAFHAVFHAEYGIPTILCIGDRAACEQAREYIPDIYTACVKVAVKRNECTELAEPYKIIEEAVKNALENYGSISLFRAEKPIKLVNTYYRTDMCESRLEREPELIRLDARTVLKITEKIEKMSDLNI